jgi:ABC-type glycerol-3-phosphate transport system permease component
VTSATRTLPVTMGSMVYDPDIWSDANAAILAGAIPLLLIGLLLARTYLRGLAAAFGGEQD